MINDWSDLEFWRSKTWEDIKRDLNGLDEASKLYYPPRQKIFNAFKLTPFKKVKVVIVGQDPYHNGYATGLAFSASCGAVAIPPSLNNIFKEYQADTGYGRPATGNLSPWAREGVLLLNTAFTVMAGAPASHSNMGWQVLVEEVLFEVSHTWEEVVFVLWGAHAAKVALPQIGNSPRVVSPHPSPLSADKGFFGSRPFTRTNALLSHRKKEMINWRLP